MTNLHLCYQKEDRKNWTSLYRTQGYWFKIKIYGSNTGFKLKRDIGCVLNLFYHKTDTG